MTPTGLVYSILTAVHVTFTAIYYVKVLSALRRVAASEYHTHPDALRRSAAAAAAYQQGAQMMPM